MTDIVPLRQRPTYNGIIQMAWALGTITGPLIGGLFAEHSTWRWVFYINFPFCGVGLVMVPLVVRLHAERASLKERLLYVDWTGGALFIASTCSFLIGTTWGGAQYAWDSWRTLVPIVLGVGGIIGTLCWERYGARNPFIRLWLFKNHHAIAAYVCAILQGLLVSHPPFSLPLLYSPSLLLPSLTCVNQFSRCSANSTTFPSTFSPCAPYHPPSPASVSCPSRALSYPPPSWSAPS